MTRTCWFVSPALLLLLFFLPLSAAEPREVKRVLVLHSENKANPGQELAEQGIREGFRSNRQFDVELYSEYLDVSRFGGSSSHAAEMADHLRRMYTGVEIHAIITVYPYALEFLLAERRALFPEAPVIAAVISRSNAEKLEHSPARRLFTTDGSVVK
jgi:hypothetical protein